jgi:hypothetical protein
MLKSINENYSSIIHEGNLTIADNEVYIIESCIFNQNGTIIVKDNATLIVRNSQFNQTNNDREYIILMDNAKMIIENSTYLAFQNFDVKISLYGEAILNVTASNMTNTYHGIWIWLEEFSKVYLTKAFLYGYGNGSRVIADHNSVANIRHSRVDYIVCWGFSLVDVYDSMIREGVKAFSDANIDLLNSYVNYIWAYGMSKMKIQYTKVFSDAPYEVALKAGGESEVSLFYSSLEDNLNVASFARVKLKNSSVKDVSAYDNAIVWLINSTATKIHFEDQAQVYNFSINLFSKMMKALSE